MPLSRYSETFCPSDLETLWNVYDRVVNERGQPCDAAAAEGLAAEIVHLRLLGMVDEEQLFQALVTERELRRA